MCMRILIKNAFLVLEDRVELGDLLTDGRTIAQVGGEAPGAAAGSKAAAKKGAEKDDAYRKLLMTPSFWLVILSAVCI